MHRLTIRQRSGAMHLPQSVAVLMAYCAQANLIGSDHAHRLITVLMTFAKRTISRGVGPRRMGNGGVQANTRDVWWSNRYLSFNRRYFPCRRPSLRETLLPILRLCIMTT